MMKYAGAVALATILSGGAAVGKTTTVEVVREVQVGPVKPVNGVGQPPLVDAFGGWSMMHYLSEAGIPYSRLHDVGGWLGGGLYVDIPNLFPDFDADENDPKNYRFHFTDELLEELAKQQVEPFFRLGVTIENWVGRRDRPYPAIRALPPKDYAKWARICEHVIRHYTEGWNNGYKFKIAYWEIWNEPDNYHFEASQKHYEGVNVMWGGGAPWETYCDFYGTVAPYLKQRFPHLKIGGYGSCGFYAGVGSDHVPGSWIAPKTKFFVECAKIFLERARAEKWPLDFFSYHSYSSPKEALRQVRYADELLNSYGFTADRCERVFNEWLPYVSRENLGSAVQAAGVAAELLGLQNGPCDLACLYDAECSTTIYSPLFNPMTLKPHKAYYAFVNFNELRKLGTAVKCSVSDDSLWAVAAATGGKAAVMIANDSDDTVPIALKGIKCKTCRITDDRRTDEPVELPREMPPHSFILATE